MNHVYGNGQSPYDDDKMHKYYESKRCEACNDKYDSDDLVELDTAWQKLTPTSIVCEWCKRDIHSELEEELFKKHIP
jgi:hypothetical protein